MNLFINYVICILIFILGNFIKVIIIYLYALIIIIFFFSLFGLSKLYEVYYFFLKKFIFCFFKFVVSLLSFAFSDWTRCSAPKKILKFLKKKIKKNNFFPKKFEFTHFFKKNIIFSRYRNINFFRYNKCYIKSRFTKICAFCKNIVYFGLLLNIFILNFFYYSFYNISINYVYFVFVVYLCILFYSGFKILINIVYK